jgi:hypothetical protein
MTEGLKNSNLKCSNNMIAALDDAGIKTSLFAFTDGEQICVRYTGETDTLKEMLFNIAASIGHRNKQENSIVEHEI